jgi:3-carboxy-cis,cis-muconate cycloisomerase
MEERLNTRVPESGIESIFTRESKWSAWMEVEVALAQAEADLGLIPKEAAAKIGAVAKYENICISNVEKALEVQEHSLMPLIDEISRLAGESAGGYVHWGATTQNVTQTGFMLLCRQAHIKTVDLLAALLRRLAKTAEKTKGYVMAGRTHGQQALPLTFGCNAGMLTQGGQGGRPAPLASRFHRIPTHFPLNIHAI